MGRGWRWLDISEQLLQNWSLWENNNINNNNYRYRESQNDYKYNDHKLSYHNEVMVIQQAKEMIHFKVHLSLN